MLDLSGHSEILAVANPLQGAKAIVPFEVMVDGDTILWRPGDPWNPGDPVKDYELRGFVRGGTVDGALWAFLHLIDGPAEAFASFSRRYGVLTIRPDGKPSSAPLHGSTNDLPTVIERDGHRWFAEPIGAWRAYAVGLRGVLAFAIAAKRGEPIGGDAVLEEFDLDRFDWDAFGLPEEYHEGGAAGHFLHWLQYLNPLRLALTLNGRPPTEARAMLGREFSRTWLSWASLTPVLTWETEPRPSLGFGSTDTLILPAGMAFSVIVGQALAVLSSDGFDRLDQCAHCGRLFEPQIKPGRHTVAYCPEHKLEGERARKLRWARRKAAERRESDSQN